MDVPDMGAKQTARLHAPGTTARQASLRKWLARSGRWRVAVGSALFAGLATVTLWQLQKQFGQVSLADLSGALHAASAWQIGLAASLTALSFTCMALYDVMAARQVAPRRVPPFASFLAGACANAVSNTLGLHALTGSVVRARIYARWGLSLTDVARLTSLSWLALGLGFMAMLAAALFVQALHSGMQSTQTAGHLGMALLIAVGLLVFVRWLAHGPGKVRLFRFTLPMPPARLAVLQMALGAVESAAAIGALYVLLPPGLAPSFALFAVGYISAVALGLLANSPGGLGVFEAGITALLAGTGRADLLAALLLYRLVYNILPFALAVIALLLFQAAPQRAQLDGG